MINSSFIIFFLNYYCFHIEDNKKASKQKKERCAIIHFNFFLVKFYHKLKHRTATTICTNELTDQVIGCFVNYIITEAWKYLKPENDLLSPNSCLGYLALIRQYFLARFQDKHIPNALHSENYSCYGPQILSHISERCKGTGASIVIPHKAATPKDNLNLVQMCVWNEDAESFIFLCLNASMYQASGRGSKIALTSIVNGDLHPVTVSVDSTLYNILCIKGPSHKTNVESQKHIFPDKVIVPIVTHVLFIIFLFIHLA